MPPCASMTTREAQQAYRRRLPLVEPLFAILKTRMGAQRFELRGSVKALTATSPHLRTELPKPAYSPNPIALHLPGVLDPSHQV